MNATNVIIRNTVHQYVTATYEDAITVKYSTNVWVDHVDLSNDRTHDKDYYDGLVDVTRASVSGHGARILALTDENDLESCMPFFTIKLNLF